MKARRRRISARTRWRRRLRVVGMGWDRMWLSTEHTAAHSNGAVLVCSASVRGCGGRMGGMSWGVSSGHGSRHASYALAHAERVSCLVERGAGGARARRRACAGVQGTSGCPGRCATAMARSTRGQYVVGASTRSQFSESSAAAMRGGDQAALPTSACERGSHACSSRTVLQPVLGPCW